MPGAGVNPQQLLAELPHLVDPGAVLFSGGGLCCTVAAVAAAEIQAVIFDLDGVLVDSEGLHMLAWDETLRRFGLSCGELPVKEWIGYPDAEIVKDLVRDLRLPVTPQQLLHRKRSIYQRLVRRRLSPLPGLDEALSGLDGVPLGLATSSGREEAELMLGSVGLRDRFRVVVTGDDVTSPKPSPEAYLKAAGLLGVSPGACIAVEDSPTGIRSALAAGLTVLAVASTVPVERLSRAARVFGSTVQAVEWIRDRIG